MKIHHFLMPVGSALGAIVLLSLLTTTYAAPAEKRAAAAQVTKSNAVPQSTYVVPSNRTEGRDPFYPNSIRTDRKIVQTTPTKIATPSVDIAFIAFSGPADHRLATITINGNGRTFAEGESGEISTRGNQIKVVCTKITEGTIELEVNGEARVVSFRGK